MRFVAALLLCLIAGQALADRHQVEAGIASIYGNGDGHAWTCVAMQKRKGGGCAIMDPGKLTAAHRTLPFGTRVEVTNKRNGRAVVVTITDRGPFVAGRIIDVTPAAADRLGFDGLAPVIVKVVS